VKRAELEPVYSKFPYVDRINPVCFTVMNLAKGETRIAKFEKSKIRAVSILKEHREISLRLKLKAGRYAIVPSCRTAGETGDFYLSLYFNISLEQVRCKDINNPKNHFKAIEEETEGIKADPWMLEIVNSRLRYMMTNEDEAISQSFLNNSKSGLMDSFAKEGKQVLE